MTSLQNNQTVKSILENLFLNGEVLTFLADTRTKVKTFYSNQSTDNTNLDIANTIKSFEIVFQARKRNYIVSFYNNRVDIELNNRYVLNIDNNPQSLDKVTGSSDTIFNIVKTNDFDSILYNIDDIIIIRFMQGRLINSLILGNLFLSVTFSDNTIEHGMKIFPRDIELDNYGRPNVNTYSFNISTSLYNTYFIDPTQYNDRFSLVEYFSQGNATNFIPLYIMFIDGQAQLNNELYEEYDDEDDPYDPNINEEYDNPILSNHHRNNEDFNYAKQQRN
jgi:hypothetical protein